MARYLSDDDILIMDFLNSNEYTCGFTKNSIWHINATSYNTYKECKIFCDGLNSCNVENNFSPIYSDNASGPIFDKSLDAIRKVVLKIKSLSLNTNTLEESLILMDITLIYKEVLSIIKKL